MKTPAALAPLLEAFFTQRLISQRQASPHTIASYRDTFRLLLKFAEKRLRRPPTSLTLDDPPAPFLASFLDDLETTRCNGARSRNQRLAALRSFFRYAALEAPQHAGLIQRVLAIPRKRHVRPVIDYLTREEMTAVLLVPDRTTRVGRRNHALLLTAMQTGLRLSELTSLQRQDITLGPGAHIRCVGKGRKERCTPLSKPTAAVLAAWMRETTASPITTLFPSSRGGRLSADAVQHLLANYVAAAAKTCPTLTRKHVTPHVLRHTAAMELLQAGIDRSLIAIWLGHESVETTQVYLDANLTLKETILAKTRPLNGKPARFRPDDSLLGFLKALRHEPDYAASWTGRSPGRRPATRHNPALGIILASYTRMVCAPCVRLPWLPTWYLIGSARSERSDSSRASHSEAEVPRPCLANARPTRGKRSAARWRPPQAALP